MHLSSSRSCFSGQHWNSFSKTMAKPIIHPVLQPQDGASVLTQTQIALCILPNLVQSHCLQEDLPASQAGEC